MPVQVGDTVSIGSHGWFENEAGGTPGDVSSISATKQGTSSILVEWGFVTGATGYDLYYATASGGPYTIVPAGNGNGSNVQDNELLVTNLDPSTTYYFKVKAKNSGGDSTSFSPVASATTDAPNTSSVITYPSQALTSLATYGGVVEVMDDETGILFDLRGLALLISETNFEYYTNDIAEYEGRNVLNRM